jgi:aspartate dehydrogenase
MLQIGIVGAGSIGETLARAIDVGQIQANLAGIADQDPVRAKKLASSLKSSPPVVQVERLVEISELVVEAASQAAVQLIVPLCLARRKSMLVMSVGALLGRDEWFKQAAAQGTHLYVPSGAIAGLDAVKAASLGSVRTALLSSRKPVAALRDAKFVLEKGISLENLSEDTVILEGPAEEVCRAFPATSNVAAALQLALGSSAKLHVKIFASPTLKRNVHEISIDGEVGTLRMSAENLPMESNPRTSRIAAFSAISLLKHITESVRIGS